MTIEAGESIKTIKNPDGSVTKRVMDVVVSFLLLVILAPFFLLIALAVKLTSRGPVFYRWNVLGKDGREIKSYKFRSMVNNADKLKDELSSNNEMTGPVFKMKNDPRITRFGSFIRKFSIDELPQFYSVLLGELSMVGPRPPSRAEYDNFEPWQRRKTSIKPGITCLWQVNGRNKISNFEDWVKLDLNYIDNWSIGLDISILLRTVVTVLKGTGE